MIVAVYGTCDNFDVVFSHVGGDRWETDVPADYTDGRYVVELYAKDTAGFLIRWSGILYMYDGRAFFLEVVRNTDKVLIGTSDDIIESWVVPSVAGGGLGGQGAIGNSVSDRGEKIYMVSSDVTNRTNNSNHFCYLGTNRWRNGFADRSV